MAFTFLSQYLDGLQVYAYGGNYPIVFRQDAAIRINVQINGCVGISEAAPTVLLHFGDACRLLCGIDLAVRRSNRFGGDCLHR